ncbi:MAG: anaerobic ribonucleoside-triphosphate reductase activating protein [Oscillospiraceae bacterium]|nr:anaerobic ribonucleoside-triphosphate reductase activating protein [Oscillospiraceae bacterium]
MMLQVSGLANDSIVDGPGFRFTIFVQGCPHRCRGCQNPQTHAFEGGTLMTTEEILEKIRRNPLLDGVTFSGGEPFCQAQALAQLGREIHRMGLNIMTYTGYTFEYLSANRDLNSYGELLDVSDWLVDGKFIESKRSLNLLFRGSENQRILDIPRSIAARQAIGADFGMDFAGCENYTSYPDYAVNYA